MRMTRGLSMKVMLFYTTSHPRNSRGPQCCPGHFSHIILDNFTPSALLEGPGHPPSHPTHSQGLCLPTGWGWPLPPRGPARPPQRGGDALVQGPAVCWCRDARASHPPTQGLGSNPPPTSCTFHPLALWPSCHRNATTSVWKQQNLNLCFCCQQRSHFSASTAAKIPKMVLSSPVRPNYY